MDWVKIGAVTVAVGTGLEKMLKVFRHVRSMSRAEAGLTVKNGEYHALRADLDQIKHAAADLEHIKQAAARTEALYAAIQIDVAIIKTATARTAERTEQIAADTASRLDLHARRMASLEQRQTNQAG